MTPSSSLVTLSVSSSLVTLSVSSSLVTLSVVFVLLLLLLLGLPVASQPPPGPDDDPSTFTGYSALLFIENCTNFTTTEEEPRNFGNVTIVYRIPSSYDEQSNGPFICPFPIVIKNIVARGVFISRFLNVQNVHISESRLSAISCNSRAVRNVSIIGVTFSGTVPKHGTLYDHTFPHSLNELTLFVGIPRFRARYHLPRGAADEGDGGGAPATPAEEWDASFDVTITRCTFTTVWDQLFHSIVLLQQDRPPNSTDYDPSRSLLLRNLDCSRNTFTASGRGIGVQRMVAPQLVGSRWSVSHNNFSPQYILLMWKGTSPTSDIFFHRSNATFVVIEHNWHYRDQDDAYTGSMVWGEMLKFFTQKGLLLVQKNTAFWQANWTDKRGYSPKNKAKGQMYMQLQEPEGDTTSGQDGGLSIRFINNNITIISKSPFGPVIAALYCFGRLQGEGKADPLARSEDPMLGVKLIEFSGNVIEFHGRRDGFECADIANKRLLLSNPLLFSDIWGDINAETHPVYMSIIAADNSILLNNNATKLGFATAFAAEFLVRFYSLRSYRILNNNITFVGKSTAFVLAAGPGDMFKDLVEWTITGNRVDASRAQVVTLDRSQYDCGILFAALPPGSTDALVAGFVFQQSAQRVTVARNTLVAGSQRDSKATVLLVSYGNGADAGEEFVAEDNVVQIVPATDPDAAAVLARNTPPSRQCVTLVVMAFPVGMLNSRYSFPLSPPVLRSVRVVRNTVFVAPTTATSLCVGLSVQQVPARDILFENNNVSCVMNAHAPLVTGDSTRQFYAYSYYVTKATLPDDSKFPGVAQLVHLVSMSLSTNADADKATVVTVRNNFFSVTQQQQQEQEQQHPDAADSFLGTVASLVNASATVLTTEFTSATFLANMRPLPAIKSSGNVVSIRGVTHTFLFLVDQTASAVESTGDVLTILPQQQQQEQQKEEEATVSLVRISRSTLVPKLQDTFALSFSSGKVTVAAVGEGSDQQQQNQKLSFITLSPRTPSNSLVSISAALHGNRFDQRQLSSVVEHSGKSTIFSSGSAAAIDKATSALDVSAPCNKLSPGDRVLDLGILMRRLGVLGAFDSSTITATGCDFTRTKSKTATRTEFAAPPPPPFQRSKVFSVTDGLQGSNMVMSVLAAVSSPAASFGVARNNAMLGLVERAKTGNCQGIDETSETVAAADSPTQMAIGSSIGKFYVGAAVGNVVLMLGLIAAAEVGGMMYLRSQGSSGWSKPYEIFARCHVCMVLFVSVSLLMCPSLTMALIAVTVAAVPTIDRAIGLVFALVILAVTVWYTVWALFLRERKEKYKATKKEQDAAGFVLRSFNYWFEGPGEWVMPQKQHTATKQDHLAFDAANPQIDGFNSKAPWFSVVEFGVQVGLALAAFVTQLVSAKVSCVTYAVVQAVILGAYLVCCLFWRPFQELFLRIFTPVMVVAQIIVVVIVAALAADGLPSWLDAVVIFVVSLQSLMSLVVVLSSFTPLTKRLLRVWKRIRGGKRGPGSSRSGGGRNSNNNNNSDGRSTTRTWNLRDVLRDDEEMLAAESAAAVGGVSLHRAAPPARSSSSSHHHHHSHRSRSSRDENSSKSPRSPSRGADRHHNHSSSSSRRRDELDVPPPRRGGGGGDHHHSRNNSSNSNGRGSSRNNTASGGGGGAAPQSRRSRQRFEEI